MISTVTLSFDLTYVDPISGQLAPRLVVTDTTNYAALGINLSTLQAKGLGQITFNGGIIVNLNTVLSPMIDLQTWNYSNGNPVFYYPLPLDMNGNVANGVFGLTYSLRLNTASAPLSVLAIPTANTVVVNGTPAWIVNFLEQGDSITLFTGNPAQSGVIVNTVVSTGSNITITTSTSIISSAYQNVQFDVTNLQHSETYQFKGCNFSDSAVNFIYDCELGNSGSWSVSNSTHLASNETITSLNCTVIYPSWTAANPSFNPKVVLTSLPYPSTNVETPLATGTYTVILTQVIQQIQSDGLIIQYSSSVTEEFKVTCAGTLCGLIPCIESLRKAHESELKANKISKYQVYVDNVLMYYIEALNYKACGEFDKYKEMIALLEATLDGAGCECGCCDDDTYYWVSNNSGASVIQTLLAEFQYRLYNGVPGVTNDSTQGVQVGAIWQNTNTNILYICTNNSAGAAVWNVYYGETKVYKAAISQNGSSAPTVIQVRNDLGGLPVFARSAAGLYTMTLTAAFPVGTLVQIGTDQAGTYNTIRASRVNNNMIAISTLNQTNTDTDSILSNTYLLVEVPK